MLVTIGSVRVLAERYNSDRQSDDPEITGREHNAHFRLPAKTVCWLPAVGS